MLRTGDYLLDTNIVIQILNKKGLTLDIEGFSTNIFLSSTVIGELMYGAYNSTKVDENIKKIINFAGDFYILDIDVDTATEYGKIKSELKKKGKPIPENDIWIAATAMKNNLILVTQDVHFKEIEGLKIETL